nr:MAG TPA: hypothetical protein [Caudoviricetes sp.]
MSRKRPDSESTRLQNGGEAEREVFSTAPELRSAPSTALASAVAAEGRK